MSKLAKKFYIDTVRVKVSPAEMSAQPYKVGETFGDNDVMVIEAIGDDYVDYSVIYAEDEQKEMDKVISDFNLGLIDRKLVKFKKKIG
jgi:hypothetical protein